MPPLNINTLILSKLLTNAGIESKILLDRIPIDKSTNNLLSSLKYFPPLDRYINILVLTNPCLRSQIDTSSPPYQTNIQIRLKGPK